MPLFYPIVIRHVYHRFIERWYSIDVRQSLTTLCLFLLLSFFTSIVINVLVPILFIKISPKSISSSSSSSSLSLFTSSHVFFPSGVTSLQCSSQQNHELQAHHPQQESLNTKRKYTKDQTKQKNVSSGK